MARFLWRDHPRNLDSGGASKEPCIGSQGWPGWGLAARGFLSPLQGLLTDPPWAFVEIMLPNWKQGHVVGGTP